MTLLEVLARESIALPNTEEQRLILSDVTWEQYSTLVNIYTDEYPSLRMTYLNGVLEIMTTSNEHERLKTIFARLLEMYFVERQIDLNGYGQTTFRQELAQRGLEPDELLWRTQRSPRYRDRNRNQQWRYRQIKCISRVRNP
jgi:Uma2 family endonuclease